MWILFRLILAGCGYAIRQWSRNRSPAADRTFRGTPYFLVRRTNKGRLYGYTLGMPRRSPTWLRLHVESRADRVFKWLGIANEQQTGDDVFDARVYVTCDHPAVAAILREEKALRAGILAALDAGFRRITFDGTMIRFDRKTTVDHGDAELTLLRDVWKASARLEDEPPSRLADPFLWKAVVVEGVIWSIAAYAIGAVVGAIVHDEDLHVWPSQVIRHGLLVAVAAFAALVGVIIVWMRGSSRGHRIIVESALVLLLALPPAAGQAVGDTNRALDDGAAIRVTRTLDSCEVRKGSKNRKTYYLWIVPEAEQTGPRIPRSIQTTRTLCEAASRGASVTLELGPGRWGFPWYREIRIGQTTWTSPM